MQSWSRQHNLHVVVLYRQVGWRWMFPSKCLLVFKVVWTLSIRISEISKNSCSFSIGFMHYLSDQIHWPFWSKFCKRHGDFHPSAVLFPQGLQPNSIPFLTFKGQSLSIYRLWFKVIWDYCFVVEKSDLKRHSPLCFMLISLKVLFIKHKSYTPKKKKRTDIHKSLPEHFLKLWKRL